MNGDAEAWLLEGQQRCCEVWMRALRLRFPERAARDCPPD